MGADKEKFKTMHNVFDEFTNRTLFKLITEGHFRGLESPISIGKEANVFSALTEKDERIIVKIYRLEACDFNTMYNYIKNDPRYSNVKKRKRNIIFAWVQREYRNLMLAREAGVTVPVPKEIMNHVLVLEFIGKGDEIAPKLKDKVPKNPKEFLDKLIINLQRLHKANLVHADLSAFNILNLNEVPVLIDMSQSTTLTHPQAGEYLLRDVHNIAQFFRKQGLQIDENELIERIKKGDVKKTKKKQKR